MILSQTSVQASAQASDSAYTDAFLDPLMTVFETLKEVLFNTQGSLSAGHSQPADSDESEG